MDEPAKTKSLFVGCWCVAWAALIGLAVFGWMGMRSWVTMLAPVVWGLLFFVPSVLRARRNWAAIESMASVSADR